MKRAWLNLGAVFVMILLITSAAGAEISKAEKNLEREAKRLNDTAKKADGENAVLKKIEAQFKVSDALVQALRNQGLGYGEIAIVLSLAQKMPGGVIEVNVQKVLSLRQGPPVAGWSQVARQLGTKLGATVSQLKKMNNESNREIKKDHARAGKKAEQEQEQEQQQEQKDRGTPGTFEGEGRPMTRGRNAM